MTEDAREQVFTPFTQSLLPFVSGIAWTDREPSILLTVAVLLVLLAALSTLGPALRAIRVDPMVALKKAWKRCREHAAPTR